MIEPTTPVNPGGFSSAAAPAAPTAAERLRLAMKMRLHSLAIRPPVPLNAAVRPAALKAPLVVERVPSNAPVKGRPKPSISSSINAVLASTRSALPVLVAASQTMPKPKKKPVKSTAEEVRTKLFKQLDIESLSQVLLCVPTSYVSCVNTIESLVGFQDGFKGLFFLRRTGQIEALDMHKRVVSAAPHASLYEAPYYTHWRHIRMLKVELQDSDGQRLWVTFFDPWRWKNSDPLGVLLIDGTLQTFGPRRMLINTTEPPPEMAGKVWARYGLPGGPKEETVRLAMAEALELESCFDEAFHSLVTDTLLSEKQLLDLAVPVIGRPYDDSREFFTSLHTPCHTDEGDLAVEVARLIAVAGVCNAAKAASMRYPNAKSAVNITLAQTRSLSQTQPEVFTADQVSAIEALVVALKSPQPLNGLLSGDVGTGKTLVFLVPAVATHLAGGKVALICPTEILANQLAANLQRRFPMAKVERVLAGGKIVDVNAILVGTSGLGSVSKKQGYVPNFLVVDEQHKLATKDRNSMVGPWTHHLEASATPIPRSLAATLFNGTQVFNLSQAPVVRKIESFVFSESQRSEVVAWMRQALDASQRVVVIYPRVEKPIESPLDQLGADIDTRSYGEPGELFDNPVVTPTPVGSVTQAAEGLELRFPGRVGMLHGKLPSAEIAQTLEDFRSGVKPIVVASTIMETGIDIADIRLLVVKNAENFGAAQLHQLRGRLARNGGPAKFVMMVNDTELLAPETLERLVMVSKTTNGFALAEADMKTRGFGDLAGLTQSGQVSCAFRLLKLSLEDFAIRHAEL